jgi:isopenicillin-N N-acyltransferase-like protein
VLTSGSFEAAVSAVTHADRSSSANYLIAHRDGRAVDVEATPDETLVLEGAVLAHANHFLWRDRPFKDLGRLEGADSLRRQDRAEGAMTSEGGARTTEQIKEALRDHDGLPDSICGHADPGVPPVQDYATIGSIAMDLTTGDLELTEGAPCTATYEPYATRDLFEAAQA